MLEFENCTIGHKQPLYTIPKLQLNQGEFVALIGANGSGKSTFMDKLIHGSFPQDKLTFQGRSWQSMKLEERAKTITLVDNHFLGFDYLLVNEYLALGRHAYTNFTGRLSTNDLAIISHYTESLRLHNLLNQATSTLSDGERQRVGIAKALIQETPIVLLDEPTAFLDYPTKKEVMTLLSEIAVKNNKLVLIASHDIDFCLEFCSRILIIEKETKLLTSHKELSHAALVEKAFGL